MSDNNFKVMVAAPNQGICMGQQGWPGRSKGWATVLLGVKVVSVKSGEVWRETSVYRCENCGSDIIVQAGTLLKDCPHCNHSSFQAGWRGLAEQAPKAEDLRSRS